jgi:hypothetical protein
MLPIVVTFVGCTLFCVVWAALRSTSKQQQRNLSELIGGLQTLDAEAVGVVAKDYLHPYGVQITMEPAEMWKLVGGLDGLRKMRENAGLMLELAAYAQQWNFEEGVIVTERMRQDARSLRWAVWLVELGVVPNHFDRYFRVRIPFRVHEAATAYHLMRERLLALYESNDIGAYSALAAAL